jgi:protein phosphatase
VLLSYGLTDKGRVRPTNEDCFAIQASLGLCVVADGMGGHNAGEVAARLAVDAVVDFVAERAARLRSAENAATFGAQAGEPPEDWPFGYDHSLSADGNLLRTAIHLANVQILEAAIVADRYAGMGTTIVAARVSAGRLTVAHVGDSRLYLMANRVLRQVTRDDSWMASMLAHDPETDPLLLMSHPLRNALTNVVGARPRTDVHVTEETLTGGELLLLSTDGVHGVLDEARLEQLLLENEDPQAIARAVVATALTRGSRDNCTAVVARYARDGMDAGCSMPGARCI